MVNSTRRFLGDALGVLRGRAVVAVALLLAIILTEGVGLLLLVPLLTVIGFGEGDAGGLASLVERALSGLGLSLELGTVLTLFFTVTLLRAVLQWWQGVNLSAATEHYLHHLRLRLYEAFTRARYDYLTHVRMTDFVHALTEEVFRVGNMVQQLVALSAHLLVTVVFIAVAWRVSPGATALVVISAVLLLVVMWQRTRRAVQIGEELSTHGARLVAAGSEHLAGIKLAKSHQAQEAHARAFESDSAAFGHVMVGVTRDHQALGTWFTVLTTLLACVFVYGALAWLDVPAGDLLLLLIIFARLVPRFRSFQSGAQSFLHALPAYDRVTGLIAVAVANAEAVVPVGKLDGPVGDIKFEGVSYRWPGRTEGGGVQKLDLTLAAGRTTAIIGPSGSGKSTIADLLTGLLRPVDGRILIGGCELEPGLLRPWRHRLGYVTQDTFLFHDTVRANLLWARPQATPIELDDALVAAQAAAFVRALPEGLDTVVGDRGVQLSGGERQRLALARALLRKPEVLVLDEATSALDTENERTFLAALDALHGQLTVVLITHRLATVSEVDFVYSIADGHVVKSGTPREVLGS